MIMIDYATCDKTIDELSEQINISKDEIIADIARKYNKSVIEVNNWIKIGKGNIKVATGILDGLSKYKRSDDVVEIKEPEQKKNEPEVRAMNLDKYHALMEKAKKEGVKPRFFANKYLEDKTIDLGSMLEDEFNKTSKEIDDLMSVNDSKQYFEPSNQIENSEPNDIVNQLQKKKYVISQKNETSPVYLKMDSGELIGPFYHSKKHEKTALDAFVKNTIYEEVKDMIKKYPNIEEIIKEVRAELSRNYDKNVINEGDVYTAGNIVEKLRNIHNKVTYPVQHIEQMQKTHPSKDYLTFDEVIAAKKSTEETPYDKFDFERSKNIMDKSCAHIKAKSYSNEELYQMIENLTTEVNALATEIGVKLKSHTIPTEQVDEKQSLKELVLKIIEKL